MKTFAICNEFWNKKQPLGYLFYYEKQKDFFIELSDDAMNEELPLILSDFHQRGIQTINAYWSRLWVQQRIVPSDRQNLGQILQSHKMKDYDEFALLTLTSGRCAQDDCFLSAMPESDLPAQISERFRFKVCDLLPCDDFQLLVFFQNGQCSRYDLSSQKGSNRFFQPILRNSMLFKQAEMETGGYGIRWSETTVIDNRELYENGTILPLDAGLFREFSASRTMNAAQAAKALGCSRQYINELVKQGRLHPLKTEAKNTLFLKSEITKLMW